VCLSAGDATNADNGANDMFYEIELVNGNLILFDDEGSSYACRPFASYREAKRIIRAWTRMYIIRVGESYRRLDEYFARLAA
jgi:hypothetical protein